MTLLIQDQDNRTITSGSLLTGGELDVRGYLQRGETSGDQAGKSRLSTKRGEDRRKLGVKAMQDLAKSLKRLLGIEETEETGTQESFTKRIRTAIASSKTTKE